MKIKSLQWSENVAEVGCLEHNGCPVFASVIKKTVETDAWITTMPVFELLQLMSDPMADNEWLEKLMHQVTAEHFHMTGTEIPAELEESKYAGMVRLAGAALSFCREHTGADGKCPEKGNFFREYADRELEEIELPEVYGDSGIGEVPADKEELFRQYLSLEKDLSQKSVFHDMDPDSFVLEQKQFRILTEALARYDDYDVWKENYLTQQMQLLQGKKFVVCAYVFLKAGEYEEILPQEQLESFEQWINSQNNAFVRGTREASEEEIRDYIALTAAQEPEE